MRICVLVDRFPVLTETFVVQEVAHLHELGQDVAVEAAGPGDGAAGDGAAAYRAHHPARRRWADLAWLLLPHPLPCAGHPLPRRRWRREEWVPPLRELAPVARRSARRGDAHLHAHFATGPALTALRLGRLLGLPYS